MGLKFEFEFVKDTGIYSFPAFIFGYEKEEKALSFAIGIWTFGISLSIKRK